MSDLKKPPGYDEALSASDAEGTPEGLGAPPPGYEQFIAPEREEEKNSGLGEQLKAANEGAAEMATFGLSTAAERALYHNERDINRRRETGAHAVGQVVGAVLPALAGDEAGAMSLIGDAGSGAAKIAGLGAEGAGLSSRLGAHVVKNAVDGALIQSTDEVSRLLSSDPHQTVGTAASHIGLAGLIGGGLGGTLGGAGELWNATVGKRLGSSLEAASHAIESPVPGEEVAQMNLGLSLPVDQAGLAGATTDAVATPKTSIDQIKEAANNLGLEASPGMLSGSKFAQKIESNLSKSGTFRGAQVSKELQEFETGLGDKLQSTLRDRTEMTPAKSAAKLKEDLVGDYQKRIAEVQAKYQELTPQLKEMEVSPLLKERVMTEVNANDFLKTSAEGRKAIRSFQRELANVENVADIKNLRTNLNRKIQTLYAGGAGGGEVGPILLDAKRALDGLRESAIEDAVAAGKKFNFAELKATDEAWQSLKSEIRNLADEAKLGNRAGSSLENLTKKLGEVKDDYIVDKFFPTDNLARLQRIQAQFPREFELARRIKLKEIFDASKDLTRGGEGKFSTGKFLAQVEKLPPEARSILFAGHEGAIRDGQTLWRALPKDFNPSGTASALSFGEMFTVKGLMNQVSDEVKYRLLRASPHLSEAMKQVGQDEGVAKAALLFAANVEKGVDAPAFKQMATFISNAIKGENQIVRATKNMFKAGEAVLPTVAVSAKEREKLDSKLKDIQANAETLFQSGDKVGHYMPDHGEAVAQTSMQAANYLNSLRPDETPKGPLDPKPEVNPVAKANFDRALDIAEKPLIVLHSVKDGTVTAQDVQHLQNIYPGLYDRLSEKLHHELITSVSKGIKVPYKTRMGMSLFLGHPLDSTMSPGGISSAQMSLRPMQGQQQMGQMPVKGRSLKSLSSVSVGFQTPSQHRQAASLKH